MKEKAMNTKKKASSSEQAKTKRKSESGTKAVVKVEKTELDQHPKKRSKSSNK